MVKGNCVFIITTFGAAHKTAWHHFGFPPSQRQTIRQIKKNLQF